MKTLTDGRTNSASITVKTSRRESSRVQPMTGEIQAQEAEPTPGFSLC